MSDIDYGALIEPVARHFWGEPNKGLTTKIGARFGSQGSKTIVFATGEWFDHEQQRGGGVTKLVIAEVDHVSTEAEAHRWLEDNGFIAKEGAPARQPRQVAEDRSDRPTSQPEHQAAPEKAEAKGRWTIVEAEPYHTPDGDLIYEVCRIQWKLPDGSWEMGKKGKPKKTFVQRRPSGLQDGSTVWGLSEGEYMRSAPGRDWKPFNDDGYDKWNPATRERGLFLPAVQHTIFHHRELELAVEAGKIILLPEGERKARVAEELGFGGTTNSGGAANWRDEFAEHFRGADVVIPIDNDEAGRAAGDRKAKSLRGIAKRVRVLDFAALDPSFKPGFDIVDWRDAGGTAEQLVQIVHTLPDWRPPPPRSQMGAVGLDNLHRPDLHHDFVIDGFLDRRGVAMMPGASGSAKTFLVIELGMCIATNRDFWGMKVKPGLVIYQAGEGKEGVTKRLDGWLQDRGVEPSAAIPFKMLPRKVNLFVDDKDTELLIAEAKAWAEYYDQPVRLVVIDTFNKAITGANENAGQDMSKVLSRLEQISEALDCAVLVPMHKSKQGEMRGHTSLTGDVSNVLNVTKLEIRDANGRQIRTVSLDKNKDGEDGRPMRFVLRQVVTGIKEDGQPIHTCVVDRPDGDDEALVQEGRLSAPQTIFLQTLKDAIDSEGQEPPEGVNSAGRRVVSYKEFEARLRKRWPFSSAEHEVEKRNKEFKQAATDAGKRLLAAKYVDRDNSVGLIWWTGRSDRPSRPKQQAAPPPPLPAAVRAELSDIGVPF